MGSSGTRGILNPVDGLAHFKLDREPPPLDLAPFVDGFWKVSWDLARTSRSSKKYCTTPA
jgi:hypothetical protein